MKFWNLGGRRRREAASHQTRKPRIESLDPRVVLASDVFVRPLPESIVTQEELSFVSVAAEAEGSDATFNYDIDRDGELAPIDALLVINAVNDSIGGETMTKDDLSAYDADSDGYLTDADVALMIEQIEASIDAIVQSALATISESEGSPTPSSTPTTPSPAPTTATPVAP